MCMRDWKGYTVLHSMNKQSGYSGRSGRRNVVIGKVPYLTQSAPATANRTTNAKAPVAVKLRTSFKSDSG